MARGITEQDVFEAADRLLIRGERPTIERVRQELGRGSPNTVNGLLDRWWAGLAQRIGGSQHPGLPASLAQACLRLYEEMQKQATSQAEQLTSDAGHRAEREKQALEQAQARLAAEKAGVLATVEALKNELAALNERNQVASRRISQLEAELANEQRRSSEALLAAKLATEERGRAATTAQAELERIREQWQGNEKRWLNEIDRLREDAKRTRLEHERQLKGVQAQLQEADQQIGAGAKERAALRLAVDAANRGLAKERDGRLSAEASLATSRQLLKQLGTAPRIRKRKAPNAAA